MTLEKIEIIAPLFDRLTDTAPYEPTESKVLKNYTLDETRAAVAQEISHLLNTRYSQIPHSLRGFNDALDRGEDLEDAHLLPYGLPDFSKYEVDKLSGQVAIEQDVTQLLAQYEPRLKDIEVYLNLSDAPRIEATLLITGILVCDPTQGRFTFPVTLPATDLSPNS